jgi:hypothetical protein
MGQGGVRVILERYVRRTILWQELAECSSGSLALQGDPYMYTPLSSLEPGVLP